MTVVLSGEKYKIHKKAPRSVNKVVGTVATLLKHYHRCFPVDFTNFFRTSF